METIMIWSWANPWIVPAACDLVALAAVVGVFATLRRRPLPAPTRVDPVTVAPVPTQGDRPVGRARLSVPDALPWVAGDRRSAVDEAMAALSRWEAAYRPSGRGLADLAGLARIDRRTPPPSDRARRDQ